MIWVSITIVVPDKSLLKRHKLQEVLKTLYCISCGMVEALQASLILPGRSELRSLIKYLGRLRKATVLIKIVS